MGHRIGHRVGHGLVDHGLGHNLPHVLSTSILVARVLVPLTRARLVDQVEFWALDTTNRNNVNLSHPRFRQRGD